MRTLNTGTFELQCTMKKFTERFSVTTDNVNVFDSLCKNKGVVYTLNLQRYIDACAEQNIQYRVIYN